MFKVVSDESYNTTGKIKPLLTIESYLFRWKKNYFTNCISVLGYGFCQNTFSLSHAEIHILNKTLISVMSYFVIPII